MTKTLLYAFVAALAAQSASALPNIVRRQGVAVPVAAAAPAVPVAAATAPATAVSNTTSTNSTARVVVHRAFLGTSCNSTIGSLDDRVWIVDECRTYYMWDSTANTTLGVARKARLNATHVIIASYRGGNGTCQPSLEDTEMSYELNLCMSQESFLDGDEEETYNVTEVYTVENWSFNLQGPSPIQGEHKSTTASEDPDREVDDPITCPAFSSLAANRTTYVNTLGSCNPGDTIYEIIVNGTVMRNTITSNFSTIDSPQYIKSIAVGGKILSANFWDKNCTKMAYGDVWLSVDGRCSVETEDPTGPVFYDYIVPLANTTSSNATSSSAAAPAATPTA